MQPLEHDVVAKEEEDDLRYLQARLHQGRPYASAVEDPQF